MKSTLNLCTVVFTGCLLSGTTAAEELTTDAAIGGAIGGALGGAVGAELGGRDGAIVGAGVGAATGAAIATREEEEGALRPPPPDVPVFVVRPERPYFCPPGHAKQGRC
jgi:hypothetical protein